MSSAHHPLRRGAGSAILVTMVSLDLPLERVRGKVEFDGHERVSSQTLLDLLEVPQRSRTAGTYRHLAKLMTELGWRAVRVRDLNGRGFREQIRGYVRTTLSIMP